MSESDYEDHCDDDDEERSKEEDYEKNLDGLNIDPAELEGVELDEHMKLLIRYGKALDIVKAAVADFLDKYPQHLLAVLMFESTNSMLGLDDGDDADNPETTISGGVMAGDALGADHETTQLRGINVCSTFAAQCAEELIMYKKFQAGELEDEYDDEDEAI